jgi:hypothetical protein
MPLDLNKAPKVPGQRKTPSAAGVEIEHEHDALLEDARMAASTDWEADFVADQLVNREKYGARWRPTDGQVAKLREIAEGPTEGPLGPSWRDDTRPSSRFHDDDIPF